MKRILPLHSIHMSVERKTFLKNVYMNKGSVKEILDYIVALCTIISCIVAVYGVFKVVNFVVNVEPIVVLLTKEVKEGNLDAKNILNGSKTTVKHDTVRERDTIYLPLDKEQETLQHERNGRRLTSEEEARFDKPSEQVSEQERQDIDNAETNFRQRMRNKAKQN